ncbi:MAG: D-alanyl-D-alanine carboxypeptidase [Clostridia bacterium]|nr:D-alanyl-D-alanine carboxypeptidase [Clostridia bacterium]
MRKVFNIFLLILIIGITICSVQNIEVSAETFDDKMTAKNYIVIDSSGYVLLEKNADEKREVASICKLMTTLLTLEEIENGNISLEDKFIASDYACSAEGSQAFLDTGCEYSVGDLLKSVIVASANDSAIVLAENISGSENEFVKKMNDKAKKLGMHNTLYGNATGLSGEEQYSTAKDTAIILNAVSKFEIYKNDSRIWLDTLTHPSGRKTELVNTNRLIRYYQYCQTGKTGFTDEAGYCLSSTANKDDLKLTCVVLGCDSSADRFADSVTLYNYAYANFKKTNVVEKDSVPEIKPIVIGGKKDSITIVCKEDFSTVIPKNSTRNIEIKYNVPNKIYAPIKEGDVVGTVEITDGENILGIVDLVSLETIDEWGYSDIIRNIVDKFGFLN